jgi:hypothetical protein
MTVPIKIDCNKFLVSLTAKWKVLLHLEEAVQEPVQTFAFHAGTVSSEDSAFVPFKYNFVKNFD